MGSDLLTSRVIKRIADLLPSDDGNRPLCHLENTSISGTHTHSGPGGFLQYTLYQITSLGFSPETFDTLVEGISQSIYRAYRNLQPGTIHISQGLLFGANRNRSPTSYLLNPKSERDTYSDVGDTDKNMILLKFTGLNDTTNPQLLGALTWFAVHGTSMNNTNMLISGDNKGYASYRMERHINGNDTLPGKGTFVAAFASTNLGDTSPNLNGPRCTDTGLPCDNETSTCNGRNELCIASGPGRDMFESTQIIGERQFLHAMELLRNAATSLHDYRVSFRHSFINMANLTVALHDGTVVRTCPAALGYSFAAGTTDGPGQFDFTQHANTSNPFWNVVSGFLSEPTADEKRCQMPKPILLNTGDLNEPYKWDPETVPISVFRLGNVLLLNVPCEFTTMAGRRLRRAVQTVTEKNGFKNMTIVIAGLSNSYTHYVTTIEEYQGQRYEAASTLYGPHTLQGYIQEFRRITKDLITENPSLTGKAPKDLSSRQISLLPPVIADICPWRAQFGDVTKEPVKKIYLAGVDIVDVKFHSANPRNNQRIEGTYLAVDKKNVNGSWETKYVDGDWCTRFIWENASTLFGISYARIIWEIPSEAEEGTYRICHYGTAKRIRNLASWISSYIPEFSNWFVIYIYKASLKLFTFMDTRLHSFLQFWSSTLTAHMQEFEGCTRPFSVTQRLE